MERQLVWIDAFKRALDNTRCKRGGKMVSLGEGFDYLESALLGVKKRGGSVWWVGNGGSAAACSHLAQDVMNRLELRSFFCSDAALLTCMANDFGYGRVYQQFLKVAWQPGDLLMAISSSGNSDNIVLSAASILEQGGELVSFSGFNRDNRLWGLDRGLAFHVPASTYGIVEICHELILHASVDSLYARMNPGMNANMNQE